MIISDKPAITQVEALREMLTRIDHLVVYAHESPINTELFQTIERAVDRLGNAIIKELRPLEQELALALLDAPVKGTHL